MESEVPDIAAEVAVKSKRRRLAPKVAPASSRSLKKQEKNAVAGVISSTDIIGAVMELVDQEQHLRYFPERVEVWERLKISDSFVTICECLKKLYNFIYSECTKAGSDKHAKFQLKWYRECSSLLSLGDDVQSCLKEGAIKWIQFKNTYKEYGSFHLNCVMITIQSAVFKQLSKHVAEELSSITKNVCSATTTEIKEEPDDVYYRFGGAAIAEMLHKRYRSIHTSPYSTRSAIAAEITILKAMECQDKSVIPASLQYRDRGFMYFPDRSLIPFIKAVDNNVRRVANRDEIKKHGKNIVAVASEQVKGDSSLHEQFKTILSKKFDCLDTESARSVYIEFTRKLYNTRLAEFIDCFRQSKVTEKGSATLSGQNLRDSLLSQHTNLNSLHVS